MPTFTEEEFEALVKRIAQEAAEEATKQAQAHVAPEMLVKQLGGVPRVSVRNWMKSKIKWQAMSKEERQAELVNRDLVGQFAGDVMPIRNAQDYVASARKTGVLIPDEILELSRRDPEDFNTVEIEGLTEKPIHIGDGRRLIKGKRIMCHPALAQLLENKGVARKINEHRQATDDNPPDAGHEPVNGLSRSDRLFPTVVRDAS